LGEPTERQANVEELIRRETRDLLKVVEEPEPVRNQRGA
jgi:hypothetical protein